MSPVGGLSSLLRMTTWLSSRLPLFGPLDFIFIFCLKKKNEHCIVATSCTWFLSMTASSNKEWKPKTTNSVVIQQSRTVGAAAATSEVPAVTFDHTDHLEPASRVLDSEEATLKLQKKLEELNVSKSQLVILPNHIQVPESERSKLSFGSFGIGFGVSATVPSGPESDQRLTPVSEASVDADENVEEEASRLEILLLDLF